MSRIIMCGPQLQFEVRVSDIDYDWFMRMGKWNVTHPPNPRKKRYAYQAMKEDGRTLMVWMHKMVLWRAIGPPPSPLHIIGDHIGGDTFDNRRHMLRWATHAMNSENRHGWHYKQMELSL